MEKIDTVFGLGVAVQLPERLERLSLCLFALASPVGFS
jgi:hypothetical protein